MSPKQYHDALTHLGFTQKSAAKFLGVTLRPAQAYANMAGQGPPKVVGKFLYLLIRLGIKPTEADFLISQGGGPKPKIQPDKLGKFVHITTSKTGSITGTRYELKSFAEQAHKMASKRREIASSKIVEE